MRHLFIALSLLLGSVLSLHGQSKHFQFQSYNTAALLAGSSTEGLALQTVNGVQHHHFFAGVGTGLDRYYHTTIPLFAEGRYGCKIKQAMLQAVVQAGAHFPVGSPNTKFESVLSNNYKAGQLWGGGIDYLIPFKKHAVIVGIAYQYKQFTRSDFNTSYNPVLSIAQDQYFKSDIQLHRLAFRVGWRW